MSSYFLSLHVIIIVIVIVGVVIVSGVSVHHSFGVICLLRGVVTRVDDGGSLAAAMRASLSGAGWRDARRRGGGPSRPPPPREPV